MSAKVKLVSLISAFVLVLGIIVIGVLAVSQQTLRMSGSVNFNIDDKSLYVKQVQIKQDNGSEPEPVIGFLPGYINGDFVMNIGDYSGDDANTVGSFALYFDIINTTTYDWFVSDVSLSPTLQSQNVSVTHSGEIDAGSSTEITDTTPLSGTIILTISSPNATSIDLSGITVTLEAIVPPTPASSFTFSYNDADHTASITNFVGSETEVVIPSTVEYNGTTYKVTAIADGFGTGAFSNSNITSIIIPDSVTSIGSYAFFYCGSLTSITISESVTRIGGYAFYNCSNLAMVNFGENSQLTSIGRETFRSCNSLTSITIPSSVTSIGDSAFYNCYSLTSITIPEGVTSIGNGAFSGCNALAEVYNYSSLTIPQGTSDSSVGYLGEYAKVVYNASDLTGVKPETRITVVDNVQYYDYGDDFIALAPAVARRTLTEVILDNRTTEINQYAFSGCRSLTSITILESVTSIGSSAFHYCSSLTSITIPSSVTSIGSYAFSYCDNLTSITIPSSVTSISESAFNYCDSLTSIEVDSLNTAYSSEDGVLFNKDKTILIRYPEGNTRTTYTIPLSVTRIGSYAFFDCDNLTSITIQSSVTSIGSYAFQSCDSLTSITISESVTSIYAYAFNNCSSLNDVTVESDDIYLALTSQSACGNLIRYVDTSGEIVKVLKSVVDSVDSGFTKNTYLNGSNFARTISEDGRYYIYTRK